MPENKTTNPNSYKSRSLSMNKFIIFSAILFLIVLAAGSMAFIFSMQQIIRTNKGSELAQMLEIERLKLEVSVNSEISLALKMADSPIIKRYFVNPYDKELEKMAFEELAAYRQAFTAKSVFWVNDTDKIFHSDDYAPFRLDPANPDNYWYPMTLHETEVYNFNINHNPDINVTNLWINAPVFDGNHRPIGIVGTGIGLSEFIDSVYKNRTSRADIYFFNAAGEITGAKNVALVAAKKNIDEELSAASVPIAANARNLGPGETIALDSPLGKVALGTIPLLEWYSVAILPENINDYNNTMTVLFLTMLMVLALVFVIFNIFIGGLIKPLKISMEEAETANRVKSAFLANMSHEIRTPMNSIVGFSELAIDSETSPKTKDYLGKIKTNAEWLLQIINDILDISKVESGKMELENIPFDLHDLFASCQTLIMPKAAEKGIMLHFYAEPSLGKRPLGDPTRLRQVLINLLSNAVKFTNSGIVKVIAEVKNINEKNITIHFEVKDSGIGMTPEQIERIFEPFMQAESGTTRKYGGTGLGLPITKNIIELMGGTLSVESVSGVGSKFSFDLVFDTIDITNDETLKTKIVFNEMEKPTFEGEVLLCEDNTMNQQVICEHLARVGLKTVIAGNGKIGVDMVRERMTGGKKQFDLVFMDMHMPVMDGLEASSKILELNAGVPVVAMTANVMSNDMEIYRKSGMRDCVGKPFTSQELWRCLMKYFRPLNWKTVNETRQVKAGHELQQKLIRYFLKDNEKKFSEITEAINAGDIILAHRLAHTLKGNAGQLGKSLLQQAAADVEYGLKDGKNLVTEVQMKLLEAELTMVLRELPLLLDETPDPAAVSLTAVTLAAEPLDRESARELIAQLEPMFEKGDPESRKFIDRLRRIPGSETLIQQMEDLDFEPAMTSLAELKKKLEYD